MCEKDGYDKKRRRVRVIRLFLAIHNGLEVSEAYICDVGMIKCIGICG